MPDATPTTPLDAVNVMLSTIGERPVNSLDAPLPPGPSLAVQILEEVDREAAMHGWHFNMEDDYPLARDVSLRIPVPTDVMRVSVPKAKYWNLDITVRRDADDKLCLYDKKMHSFAMPSDLKATVILAFPFSDTPEAYRRYVTVRAARIFQDRTVGSQAHHAYNTMDEQRALSFLKQHEDDVDGRTIFDSYDAARPLMRGYPRLRSL